jgi:hypothetical protein
MAKWAAWAAVASVFSLTGCFSDDTSGAAAGSGPTGGSAGAPTGSTVGTGGGGASGGRADAANGSDASSDTGSEATAGTGGIGGMGGTGGTGGTDIIDASGERVFDMDDGGIPPDAAIGSCSRASWNVSASSSGPNDPPVNAIDGAQGTRWSTGAAQGPGQFYAIDFGGYVQLSQITLNSAGSVGDYPHGYEVAVSTDGIDFSRIIAAASVDVPPLNDILTIDFPLHSARYLRINQTGAAGNWWSIHELTAVCSVPGNAVDPLACNADAGVRDAGGGDPFARANWRATVSPAPDGGPNAPSNAFDGDITTKWTTGAPQIGTESFKLDLGSIGCISQVWITSEGNETPVDYRLEISVDDASYTVVSRGRGQNLMQLVFPSHLARYVRIVQLGMSANAWSINEIAVRP